MTEGGCSRSGTIRCDVARLRVAQARANGWRERRGGRQPRRCQGGVPGGVGGRRVGRLPEKKADEKCSTGVRLLMTHLCHKPLGGGGRDSAVQQSVQCSSLCSAAVYLP